jgi:hypothetical protein
LSSELCRTTCTFIVESQFDARTCHICDLIWNKIVPRLSSSTTTFPTVVLISSPLSRPLYQAMSSPDRLYWSAIHPTSLKQSYRSYVSRTIGRPTPAPLFFASEIVAATHGWSSDGRGILPSTRGFHSAWMKSSMDRSETRGICLPLIGDTVCPKHFFATLVHLLT